MRKYKGHHQQGFVAAVLLTVVLLSAIAVALTMMSRSTNNRVDENRDDANARILLAQGQDFRVGFMRFLENGQYTAAQMTFDNNPTTGLFTTTPGRELVFRHRPPEAAGIAGSPPDYYYNNNVTLPGVGNALSADYVVIAGPLTVGVCHAINHLVHGDALTDNLATSTTSFTKWSINAPVSDRTNTDPHYLGRLEGCIKTTDNKYLYFTTLAAN